MVAENPFEKKLIRGKQFWKIIQEINSWNLWPKVLPIFFPFRVQPPTPLSPSLFVSFSYFSFSKLLLLLYQFFNVLDHIAIKSMASKPGPEIGNSSLLDHRRQKFSAWFIQFHGKNFWLFSTTVGEMGLWVFLSWRSLIYIYIFFPQRKCIFFFFANFLKGNVMKPRKQSINLLKLELRICFLTWAKNRKNFIKIVMTWETNRTYAVWKKL